ncbi:SGNH/GDSL hydrolase family protein [Desulfovibrio aminophilus]|nr:SGNH/GDSL hydrolase family protein [Desulfovibrio aminophilus]MCM0754783.1 SGNH/GDSL hydrolase family protein [Desulfovibrio aminophilus]
MRKKLLNLLLALTSVGLVYALVEFLLFPLLLPFLSPAAYHSFPRDMRLPGQTSKAGLLPRPGYLALAGDSYAQGKGDWFIDLGYDRASRFQAAHLLQDALGRDVVSFGRSGAGSVDGLILEPLQDLRAMRRRGLKIPDPGCLLLYFYEGNDLQNNGSFLRRYFDPFHPREDLRRPGVFRAFLDDMTTRFASGASTEPGDDLLFSNLVLRFLRDHVWYRLTRRVVDPDPPMPPGIVNAAVVGGRAVFLPDRLQAPPLDEPGADDSLFVFEQSVLYIRDALPKTRCVVVYVPSPLACYALSAARVRTYDRPDVDHTPAQVAAGSDQLAAHVRAFAEGNGLGFIDTRPEVRAAAARELLHGPRDWDHFNKAGYEAFARGIEDGLTRGACGPGAQP